MLRRSKSQAPIPEDEEVTNGDSLQRMDVGMRRGSGTGAIPQPSRMATASGARAETAWKRRHSIAAAQKNNDWADFFLSTAATDGSIAAFLSIKNESSPTDAEYFYNFIPKAVRESDMVYKELLAVYNALRYWISREILPGKRVLISIINPEVNSLLKKAKVKGKLGPQKILMLKEIDQMCAKTKVELRVAELSGESNNMIIHSLVRSDQPAHKQKFKMHLMSMSHEKGGPFVAKERLFPPVYV